MALDEFRGHEEKKPTPYSDSVESQCHIEASHGMNLLSIMHDGILSSKTEDSLFTRCMEREQLKHRSNDKPARLN